LTIIIRPAHDDDVERCQDIALRAWEPINELRHVLLGELLWDRVCADWKARKAAEIAKAFGLEPRRVLIAVDRDASQGNPDVVVGFATYKCDEASRIGEIGNNAVDPRWQRQGIATRLHTEVLARFRQEGMRVASVSTGLDEAHAPARAAYKKVGLTVPLDSVVLYRLL
jgi:GNAT superfamily N-acetyltransferase